MAQEGEKKNWKQRLRAEAPLSFRIRRSAQPVMVTADSKRSVTAALELMRIKATRFTDDFNVFQQVLLAMLAGFFITFGALLSVVLSIGVKSSLGIGFSNLLTSLGFIGGFSLVMLSGAALFTEANVFIPIKLLRSRKGTLRSITFWVLCYFGNLAGALLLSACFLGAEILTSAATDRLGEIVDEKLVYADTGAGGWFQIVLSAIMGNFLVGVAAVMASSTGSVTGKIAAVAFPVTMFVSTGVQHSVANMAYLSMALVTGGTNATWRTCILWNLLPATLGNLIGGGILVGLVFFFIFGTGGKRYAHPRPPSQIFEHDSDSDDEEEV